MLLQNRTVLISGSSKRIGRSLALGLARKGANLVIHYNTSHSDAVSLQKEIGSLGQKAWIEKADFSDPQHTQQFAREVISQHQVTDLINNASVFEDLTWSNTTLADWEKHLAINLTAPFLLSQAFAKSRKEGQTGRIINLLDWRAFRPGPDHFPYTISKSALAAMTNSLAASLAPRITVNGIALGAILLPSYGGDEESILKSVPNSRWARMEEIEETIMFFLTGPDYITGEVIHLDGGRHLV